MHTTNAYFDSLHGKKASEEVPQDSESLKKDEIDKNMIERRRAMETVHQQLLRMVLLKGLCLEEDNDDSLVPRKLFLFKIEDF